MRLTKLTVNGFKSFADTTEFAFEHPITGVVGPNGCGKSNVVDAIKWVLGERSSKSLRGTEMLDVIFAGSAGRKPGGMASVKLTFENPVVDERAIERASERARAEEESTDADASASGTASVPDAPRTTHHARRLPFDADEVEIERRLYRDGTSEYLINGRQARLKDIREMFLDTGVGADAYSIIEQGKVDAMLLASPQERRTIFEEAAGIAKYKQRRVEAQRKLERTETNLKITKDELDATERRLRMIRGQAAKARKFQELDAELRAWRMALAFDQHEDLCARIDGLTSRQGRLAGERDAAHTVVAELEQRRQELEQERHAALAAVRSIEQRKLSAEHALAQAQQRRQMISRLVDQIEADANADRAALSDGRARLSEAETSIVAQREEIAALAEKLGEAERSLQESAMARAAVAEALGDAQRQGQMRGAAAARIDRERVQLVAQVESAARMAAGLREQIDKLGADGARAEQECEALRTQRAAAADAMERARDGANATGAELSEAEAQLAQLGEDRMARAGEAGSLQQELARVETRLAALTEMTRERVGFAEAVRRAMSLRDEGRGLRGVIAPLADLIRTKTDARTGGAVELALGRDLQALVVGSLADVPGDEDLGAVGGRVAFLPLAGRSGAPAAESADVPGIVALRPLVEPASEGEHAAALDALLDSLLGRAYLVPDLDAAVLLGAGPLPGCRFVTLAGQVIDPQGRIESGPRDAGASQGIGLLERHNELAALRATAAEVAARLGVAQQSLSAVDEEASALSAKVGRLRAALGEAQRSAAVEGGRAERFGHEVERLERESARREAEAAQLRERLARFESDASSQREKAAALGRLAEEEMAAAAALVAELGAHQARADAAAEQVAAARVEAGRLNQELSGARREVSRLETMRDEQSRRVRDIESRLASHAGRLEEQAVGANEAIATIESATGAIASLAGELEGASESLAVVEAGWAEAGERLSAARQRVSIVERDWHSLEASRRELEVKRETVEQRTLEDLGTDLRTHGAEYRELIASGGVSRPDHAVAQRAIDEHKREIARLGSVNLDALEEEKNLEGQNEALVRQVQDIEAARVQLATLIDRLNVVSKERFGDVFRTIQEQFGGESGMFRRLFGGGKAEVRLMPLVKEVEQPDGSVAKVETDEIDLLESGIEVVAKPPGKEPRAISQLSGGEKTLTAVALLMSIFRSKPSCFCVLDEVDAALDEGNVGRFNSVIRDFTDRSAFIVITHNKRTMQNADHLYGVTMQERGVSTRVSVRFEEVGKDGKITAPKAHAEERPAAPTVEADPAADAPRQRKEAKPRRPEPALAEAAGSDGSGGGVAVVTEPPVIILPQPAPIIEPSAEDRRAGASVVAPVVTAPLGIGESPDQQTTLGMSPLKRALAKLREMQN